MNSYIYYIYVIYTDLFDSSFSTYKYGGEHVTNHVLINTYNYKYKLNVVLAVTCILVIYVL